MVSLLAAALVATAPDAGGARPMEPPTVRTGAEVKAALGQRVAVVGTLSRVPMGKGKGSWLGTGLVLEDRDTVYVTYGAPPTGWEALVGKRVRVEGRLLEFLSKKEQSLVAPHLHDWSTPMELKPEPVRLVGVAQDAKGGAVVVVDGSPVYLRGMDSWRSDVVGKRVVVEGAVADEQYLPEATKDEKGAWSQGAVGKQRVISPASWKLAD